MSLRGIGVSSTAAVERCIAGSEQHKQHKQQVTTTARVDGTMHSTDTHSSSSSSSSSSSRRGRGKAVVDNSADAVAACILPVVRTQVLYSQLDVRNVALDASFFTFATSVAQFEAQSLAIGWRGLNERTFAFHRLCSLLWEQVTQLTVTHTGYTSISLCEDKAIESVVVRDNTALASLVVPRPVTQLSAANCPRLSALSLPHAEVLDLSFTNVTDTRQLCSTWGSRVLVYRGVRGSLLAKHGSQLLRRCVERAQMVDFSSSAWLHRLDDVSSAVSRPIMLSADTQLFVRANGRTLAVREAPVVLSLLNSPLQCRIVFQQERVQLLGRQQLQPTFHFACSCSPGQRRRGGVCEAEPVPVALIASTTVLSVLVTAAAVYVALQRRRRTAERAHARMRRIEALESAWRIDYADLAVLGRLGEGTYGCVLKADWDGLVVAVKELHEVVRVFDTGSEAEFQRESEFLQKTRHPNVVRFFGSGHKPDDGAPFMVLEYIPLGSLYDFLRPKEGSLQSWIARRRQVARSYDDDDGLVLVSHSGTLRPRAPSTGWTLGWATPFGVRRSTTTTTTTTGMGTTTSCSSISSLDSGSGPLTLPLLPYDAHGDNNHDDVEMNVLNDHSSGMADGQGGDSVCPATAEELKLRLARDVACGMSFIHSLGKVHRLVGLYVFGGGLLVRGEGQERVCKEGWRRMRVNTKLPTHPHAYKHAHTHARTHAHTHTHVFQRSQVWERAHLQQSSGKDC